jgi:hypothetical protein
MLTLVANFPHGLTEELLALVRGFDRAMIAGLVHEGLATTARGESLRVLAAQL